MKNGVYLIGAGPGDIKLITVKGLDLLKVCDVVVYDELVNTGLLTQTKEECKKIYVGKKAGNHSMKQEDINELLLSLSIEYPVVARLKGGDPYVFGRGSEEAEYLIGHKVYVETIPGITSAIGGLASAGIPVTARSIATSFHVITGHISKESNPIQYEILAKLDGTLVFLMGVNNLKNIVDHLLKGGKPEETPVAIIYKASTAEQRVYTGSLKTIAEIAYDNQIQSPALIVVGEVVNYHGILPSLDIEHLERPNVVVTRSIDRSSKFSEKLEALGANVIEMPTIKSLPINKNDLIHQIKQLNEMAGVIFTSSVAVELFFKVLFELGYDARILHGLEMIVVGKETSKTLREYGVIADQVPENYSKQGIIKLFEDKNLVGEKYLLPRSERSDNDWISELKKYITPIIIDCYKTITDTSSYCDLNLVKKADYITFTSSSTVEGFIERVKQEDLFVNDILQNLKIVAIGPMTAETLSKNNIHADLIPREYTIQGMVDEIYQDFYGGNVYDQ
jgi:uroporphyrin-III C-methyltransferase